MSKTEYDLKATWILPWHTPKTVQYTGGLQYPAIQITTQ